MSLFGRSSLENNYPLLKNTPQFKPVDSIYEGRLRQFIDTDGQYNDLNLPKFYKRARQVLSDKKSPSETTEPGVWLRKWDAPNEDKPLFKEVIPDKLNDFISCKPNENITFGPKWTSHWFEVTARISRKWFDEVSANDKNEVLTLLWDAGCEAMVFDQSGCPIQGLTGEAERTEFELPLEWFKAVTDCMQTTFFIECGCNTMFGGGGDSYSVRECEIVQYNAQAKALFYDFWVLSDAARENDGPQKHKAREICNRIMDVFDCNDASSIDSCRNIASEFLGNNVDTHKVFKETKLNKYNAVYAIGNCHIDTAWLWNFATSKTKVARSWSTQLRLIEKYPEYVFVASAAQHFKWLVQYYPDLYKKVKKAAMEGRFIPLGGSWVENDTNLPSGEGLSRQFLLGQRYFQHLFGVKSNIFWLPDSFGYSSQIPQICRLSGIPNFLTQKLSWNNINTFPQNSFNWVGIDCSQVLVHMPPDNTYTADANYGDVKRTTFNHQNLCNDQKGMLLYGKGDGGGGPTPAMVEKLRRCRGFADAAGGSFPQVQMGCTVNDFFDDLRLDTDNGKKLPSWRGELYLEYHRGTYTVQAKVKNYMRESEHLMKNVELVATYASLLTDYKYPLAKIESLWQDICLCQFHDVLPGSCIGKVYHEEVWPMLSEVVAKEQKLLENALDKLDISLKKKEGYSMVKLSSLPWNKLHIGKVSNAPLDGITSQKVDNSYFVAFEGSTIMKPVNTIKNAVSITETTDGYAMENGKIKALITEDGIITSLYDIENDKEVIDSSTTGANQYVMYSDTPLNFPAWDTELYSLGKYKLVGKAKQIVIKNTGPLVCELEVEHVLSATSSIKTIISLSANSDKIVFNCNVEWSEKYQFLKVQFPVQVFSEVASYETQFGITKRPTHFNTSWETAKFEVCMHKFMDISDYNYGVSILNCNKYGGSIHGNIMTLSLLRSAKSPDETADIGSHSFSYSIMPHKGPLGVETVRAGWEFNERMPSEVYIPDDKKHLKLLNSISKFVNLEGDSNVVLSYVKRGEDDVDVDYKDGLMTNLPRNNNSVVLRMYESLGGEGRVRVKLNVKGTRVLKVNLLEEKMDDLEFKELGDAIEFNVKLRAFEIGTFKVILE
ncbi:alpha-mannosidase [Martiniozyma asiatica (nom. inval.)]|nr:alpha-mannosidase [Martiniozyma asiatica]